MHAHDLPQPAFNSLAPRKRLAESSRGHQCNADAVLAYFEKLRLLSCEGGRRVDRVDRCSAGGPTKACAKVCPVVTAGGPPAGSLWAVAELRQLPVVIRTPAELSSSVGCRGSGLEGAALEWSSPKATDMRSAEGGKERVVLVSVKSQLALGTV